MTSNEDIIIPPKPQLKQPRWFTEVYDGMESDIYNDILSAQFWKIWDEKPDSLVDAYARARTEAGAIQRSAVVLDGIADAANRAFIKALYIMDRRKLYMMGLDPKEEFDTLREWLEARIPRLEGSTSEIYDLQFISETFLPMLEETTNGWRPEKMLSIAIAWSKVRAIIPYLRGITDEYLDSRKRIQEEIDKLQGIIKVSPPEESKIYTQKLQALDTEHEKVLGKLREGTQKALDAVADPDKSRKAVRQELMHTEARQQELEIYKGFKFLLPEGTVYVLAVPDKMTTAIEFALRTTADFDLSDPFVVLKALAAMITKEDQD